MTTNPLNVPLTSSHSVPDDRPPAAAYPPPSTYSSPSGYSTPTGPSSPFSPTPPGAATRPAGPLSASDERTWAMLAHLSTVIATVFSAGWLSFLGPLVIWGVFKDRSSFVRESAARAFNFNILLWAVSIAAWICLFTVILAPVAILLWVGALIAGLYHHIKATMAASRGELYTYPTSISILH